MGSANCISRVGALALALAIGIGLAATPWGASAKPTDDPGCSTQCGVGGFHLENPAVPVADGQGYLSSGGNAKGALYKGPDVLFGDPNLNVFAAGPSRQTGPNAGHLVLSGSINGTQSGTFHDDPRTDEVEQDFRGHRTGDLGG